MIDPFFFFLGNLGISLSFATPNYMYLYNEQIKDAFKK